MSLILLTRPLADCQKLADELTHMGFKTMFEPLMEINFFDDITIDLTDMQALLFTSANGVSAFARLVKTRDITAYCVGDSTANMAKSYGFSHILSADGNINDLADIVINNANINDGGLYHAAANIIAGDLGALLSAKGFKYQRAILYQAIYSKALHKKTIAAILNEDINAILLFSPRTAVILLENINKSSLMDKCGKISLFCLSQNVKSQIDSVAWKEVIASSEPNQAALLNLLRERMGSCNAK